MITACMFAVGGGDGDVAWRVRSLLGHVLLAVASLLWCGFYMTLEEFFCKGINKNKSHLSLRNSLVTQFTIYMSRIVVFPQTR